MRAQAGWAGAGRCCRVDWAGGARRAGQRQRLPPRPLPFRTRFGAPWQPRLLRGPLPRSAVINHLKSRHPDLKPLLMLHVGRTKAPQARFTGALQAWGRVGDEGAGAGCLVALLAAALSAAPPLPLEPAAAPALAFPPGQGA